MQPDYDEIYRNATGTGGPPWEIGGPQPALARSLDGVRGPRVLDLGCGTGALAIALARRRHDVTAVDLSRVAIETARARAADEGVTVHFEVQDATTMPAPEVPFDAVFDSGLLHNLHRYDADALAAYLAVLPVLTAPGATLTVLTVSQAAGIHWTITEGYLRATFAAPDWTAPTVEQIDVAALVAGEQLALPGFLLRTVRAG